MSTHLGTVQGGAGGPLRPTRMEPDLCYRAMMGRDARFDGRFFVGVRTTGIFCRPICSAPKPKRRNVLFYASAAAAAQAGFRPCLRCRPEASPGSPAWLGTEVTVRRALRLIGEGGLDHSDVESFSRLLGVGARHLRRLFQEHLGASPLAVARMRRVMFAKKLIDDTDLPITRIALSSGFNSIRRFNTSIRDTYQRAPRELRALARRNATDASIGVQARLHATDASTGAITIRLSARPPFDWDSLVRFLGPRATPGVECVTATSYRRTFRIEEVEGIVEMVPVDDSCVLLRVHADEVPGLLQVVERVRGLLDLDADPLLIQEHLGRHRVLCPLVARHPGLRVPGAWDAAELAVRAILGQQVTVAGATTLAGRLVAALGETIRGVARAFCTGALPFACSSPDELVARLRSIPGVGEWTAQYVAMRAFREPDAFPASDLGLRKALSAKGTVPTAREVTELAESWRPYRAYAAMHLWSKTPAAQDIRNARHISNKMRR